MEEMNKEEFNEVRTKNKTGKHGKKKMNKWLKVILVLLLIIVLVTIIIVGIFIGGKLSKITFKGLDESNLGINDNLYSEVNGLTKKEYERVINVVLLGSDSKDMSDQYNGQSDAIMIISINPKFKSIKLISIPRDTAAYIEGKKDRQKINVAFYLGREQLALKTINQNFGLNLKEYITINISSMYDIINELGGVEVEITKEEMKWINEYIDMFYGFSGGKVKKVTQYGKVNLTGEQAASFVKERMSGTSNKDLSEHSDYGRTRRQRDVFISMLNKIATKDAKEISRITDMILSKVTTNVNVAKYTAMLPEFIMNKNAYLKNITSVMLPSLDYTKQIIEKGLYINVTNYEKAKKDFIKYMYEM